MAPLTVYKGHGTENDFVIVEDLAGDLQLSDGFVRALCDRRAGIGADGVLRVVRTSAVDRATAQSIDLDPTATAPEFFMDYRNADGSVAEMCGNGARVFVRYLLDRGLVELAGLRIATRAGVVAVSGPGDGEPDSWITVALGPAGWLDAAPRVQAPGLASPRPGVAVSMPNPHVVVFVDESELDALDLTRPPSVEPPLPSGQNVEFVVRGADKLRMRVHERGVGETRSCGTGIAAATVAAAVAARPGGGEGELVGGDGGPAGAASARPVGGDGRPWRIEVAGGVCAARWQSDGHVLLSGPAVVVARVVLETEWIAAVRG
jgi:diaminopimelate epimerase